MDDLFGIAFFLFSLVPLTNSPILSAEIGQVADRRLGHPRADLNRGLCALPGGANRFPHLRTKLRNHQSSIELHAGFRYAHASLSELTFILQSIDSGNPQAAGHSCRWSMTHCVGWPRPRWRANHSDNAGRQRRSSRWLRGFHCRVDASVQHCDPAGMAVAVSYPHLIKPPGAAALLPACLSLTAGVMFSP